MSTRNSALAKADIFSMRRRLFINEVNEAKASKTPHLMESKGKEREHFIGEIRQAIINLVLQNGKFDSRGELVDCDKAFNNTFVFSKTHHFKTRSHDWVDTNMVNVTNDGEITLGNRKPEETDYNTAKLVGIGEYICVFRWIAEDL